jgi:Icc-related predicted phosphoesterase
MRLAFAADLHGNLSLYQGLLELATSAQAQAVVVGGDLFPHESRIDRAIAVQRAFLDDAIRPLLIRFRADRPDAIVALLPGNDDWEASALPGLAALERDGLAISIHGRALPLAEGLWIAGYACVPPTPFSIKDFERPDKGSQRGVSFGKAYSSETGGIAPLSEFEFLKRPNIAAELEALAQQSDPARTVYVCHTPPANTPLDQMRGERHVGSPGLRAFIEQRQPPLTLHGHIHESPMQSGQFACQLGITWSINPGRDAQQLYAVTLDTDDIAGTLAHTVLGTRLGGKEMGR